MVRNFTHRFTLLSSLAAAAVMLLPGAAQAVPSFARQTGLACEACHTVFPELTPFGRRFKLSGYTMDSLAQVSAKGASGLELNKIPPLSFMLQASITSTNKAAADPNGGSAQNSNVLFPQQASLFYAGRIAPNLGAFVQMTYDGTSSSFGWDNTDIRYAKNVNSNFLWGVSLNNNPTVQDVWNSTGAWQVPFDQRNDNAPAAAAGPQIEGVADNGVAGLSVYGYWNNSIYAELGAYRSAPAVAGPANSANSSNVIDNYAPYWRLAYERQWDSNSWEVGAYGMNLKMFPGNGAPLSGPTDDYNDVAVDTQYQHIGGQNIYSLDATYIKESQTLNASGGGSPDLKTWRIGGHYIYRREYVVGLGAFSTNGSASLQTDTNGWTTELDWMPYENTKLALQYTAFNKYNGVTSNASDNNTLYLLGWVAF